MNGTPIPIEELVGCRSKVRVLKALLGAEEPLAGRETARRAEVSQRAAVRSLDQLTDLGIVFRTVEPTQHNYRLNRKHFLVRNGIVPLFRAEMDLMEALEKRLVKAFEPMAGGSMPDLQGLVILQAPEETDGSACIAMLVILRTIGSEMDATRIVRDISVETEEEFQIAIRNLILPMDVVRRRVAEGEKIMSEFARGGRVVLGKGPSEITVPGTGKRQDGGILSIFRKAETLDSQ